MCWLKCLTKLSSARATRARSRCRVSVAPRTGIEVDGRGVSPSERVILGNITFFEETSASCISQGCGFKADAVFVVAVKHQGKRWRRISTRPSNRRSTSPCGTLAHALQCFEAHADDLPLGWRPYDSPGHWSGLRMAGALQRTLDGDVS